LDLVAEREYDDITVGDIISAAPTSAARPSTNTTRTRTEVFRAMSMAAWKRAPTRRWAASTRAYLADWLQIFWDNRIGRAG